MLPFGCTEKGKESDSISVKSYEIARLAQDYHAAASHLTEMAALDSSGKPWVYDSLAFYHYFYLVTPGVVRNTHTAKFYAQKGLDINPSNHFLMEIKAKLDLEDQKVEIAQASFDKLWKTTNDYTYLWILSYIEAMRQDGLKTADSVCQAVLSNPAAEKKTVRLEFPQERVQETVQARAAFLYLRASFFLDRKNSNGAAELLKEAMKLEPNFYGASRLIYMMQQGGQAR